MNTKVVIIGAGGHAKVIADIVEKSKDVVYGFLDDNIKNGTIIDNNKKWKIIGNLNMISSLSKNNKKLKFIVAIGDNNIRKKIVDKAFLDGRYYIAIHPNSNIALNVKIKEGTVIMANACINSSSIIGKHCIINTGAIVEHDNAIEDFIHISPNATLCGTVKVGTLTHIGAGATIRNNISIQQNTIIGAGAVVVKDIENKGVYIGTPAKILKKSNIL